MSDLDTVQAVHDVLLAQGVKHVTSVRRTSGGGNNRGYHVTTDAGEQFVKFYFRHPADPRDRLGVEYRFSQFAVAHGVDMVPRPLWSDVVRGAAGYAFVGGSTLTPGALRVSHVQEALDFWADLNRHRSAADATALPVASEACFSVVDHLACVSRRIERLTQLTVQDDADGAGEAFVRDRLAPAWAESQARALIAARYLPIPPAVAIPASFRCLSPSDFGFHNAIVTDAGTLVFHDFEYAGWDDPAKLVGDFFAQPRVPVPAQWRDLLVERVVRELALPAWYTVRIDALLDVYRLKWCCIALNEFLPTGATRRQFAGDGGAWALRKLRQLDTATRLLDGLETRQE